MLEQFLLKIRQSYFIQVYRISRDRNFNFLKMNKTWCSVLQNKKQKVNVWNQLIKKYKHEDDSWLKYIM